ncbi:hypothetical protein J6590_094458 [Homalodisca vitripennis]|nr:hypothetical protein J6590_094458 [Homalodisca vitripennis]
MIHITECELVNLRVTLIHDRKPEVASVLRAVIRDLALSANHFNGNITFHLVHSLRLTPEPFPARRVLVMTAVGNCQCRVYTTRYSLSLNCPRRQGSSQHV